MEFNLVKDEVKHFGRSNEVRTYTLNGSVSGSIEEQGTWFTTAKSLEGGSVSQVVQRHIGSWHVVRALVLLLHTNTVTRAER